jgi:hypothetical protein
LKTVNGKDPIKGEIDLLRKSTQAIQCGDYLNLEPLISNLGDLNERSSYAGLKTSYHDNLWARFRSLSQRILISQAIKAKLDGS